MQHQFNTINSQVNSLAVKILPIWDRGFDKQMATLGKAHGIYIDIFKELQSALGRLYGYVAGVIELSRRFGHGFHYSNHEFLDFTPNLTDRTLKRRKVEGANFVTVKHGAKYRSIYYLNISWFTNFINGVLVKLGVQQGQNGPPHIISTDLSSNPSTISQSHIGFEVLNEYDNFIKPSEAKPVKPSKPKSNAIKDYGVCSEEQRAVVDRLCSMGIYLALALSFVAKQPLNLIYDKIQNAKQRGIAPNKIGAYIRQALQNIDSDSDANQLTHADTGGRVSKNNNNEVADMGKPAAPGPSAYETRIIIAKLEMVRKASKAVVSQSRAEIKEALQKGLVKK